MLLQIERAGVFLSFIFNVDSTLSNETKLWSFWSKCFAVTHLILQKSHLSLLLSSSGHLSTMRKTGAQNSNLSHFLQSFDEAVPLGGTLSSPVSLISGSAKALSTGYSQISESC